MNRGGWAALEPRQRHVLMSTVAANALIFLDQTAVAVALPAIGQEFHTQAHQLQWVITAYLLALAVFMPAALGWTQMLVSWPTGLKLPC
jgi:MFS family permease